MAEIAFLRTSLESTKRLLGYEAVSTCHLFCSENRTQRVPFWNAKQTRTISGAVHKPMLHSHMRTLGIDFAAQSENTAVRMLPGERRRDRVLAIEEEKRYLAAAPPLLRDVTTVLRCARDRRCPESPSVHSQLPERCAPRRPTAALVAALPLSEPMPHRVSVKPISTP
jgi:hypothetical protein